MRLAALAANRWGRTWCSLVRRAGFRHPDVNVPVRVGGRRVVPDFRRPQQRLILEADGARYRDGEVAREDDAERHAPLEAPLAAAGQRVLRVRWERANVPRIPDRAAHQGRRRAVRLALGAAMIPANRSKNGNDAEPGVRGDAASGGGSKRSGSYTSRA